MKRAARPLKNIQAEQLITQKEALQTLLAHYKKTARKRKWEIFGKCPLCDAADFDCYGCPWLWFEGPRNKCLPPDGQELRGYIKKRIQKIPEWIKTIEEELEARNYFEKTLRKNLSKYTRRIGGWLKKKEKK